MLLIWLSFKWENKLNFQEENKLKHILPKQKAEPTETLPRKVLRIHTENKLFIFRSSQKHVVTYLND